MEKRTKTEQELLKCMNTLLEYVDSSFNQSGSISIVAEELVNPTNELSYAPRVVSMGPRYNGIKQELLHMEEIKLRCMSSLFHRVAKGGKIEEITEKCNKAIWDLNEKIRASYVLEIILETYELTKIMFVDSCFMLELLITKGFELYPELPNHLNVDSDPSPFTRQVLENDEVLSDLTLFENQIPIFIVHELSKTLFPYFSEQDPKERETMFNNIALSILGYSHLPHEVQSRKIELPHLLDVVHSFVNINNNNNNNNNNKIVNNNNKNNPERVVDITNSTQTQNVKAETKVKLKRCATRLQAAGVSIQAQNKGAKGFDFEFKFEEGKLEITPLIITKTTDAKWRNIIAWEHHKTDWKKSYSNNKGTNGNEIISNTCGKFTSAALIFNDLICCVDDVKLLKEKNIIVDHMKMSNHELEEFIRSMTFGVEYGIVGSGYVKLVEDLNKHSTVILVMGILKKLRHYFICHLEWLIKFMKKEYHFVATLVSLLTVVQTVYAIIAYQLPK